MPLPAHGASPISANLSTCRKTSLLYSDIGQSQVEADNRTAIHLFVLSVPAVHLDDFGFVSVEIGVRSRATECLRPISGESLDMLWVEAMAERMHHDVVGHHPLMPGISKTAQSFVSTRCLEESLHLPMMTIPSCLCKTLSPAGSRGLRFPMGR